MAEHETCIGASDEEWTDIRSALQYEPATGQFRWARNITNVKAGAITGSRVKKGYLLIRFKRRQHLAHRLAWFWMTGAWPVALIDHINGDKADNRWVNLREATNAENLMNRGKNQNNTSGFKGVSFDKKAGQYAAYLTIHRARRFLGYFATAEAAHAAYCDACRSAAPVFGKF